MDQASSRKRQADGSRMRIEDASFVLRVASVDLKYWKGPLVSLLIHLDNSHNLHIVSILSHSDRSMLLFFG
jgi:hypothetical protein